MRELDGHITISRVRCGEGDDYIEIRMGDRLSNITFAEAKLSLAAYAELITGLSHVDCKIEVRGLENVGKRYEHQTRTIVCPLDTYNSDELSAWLKDHGQVEGWHANTYLRSQGSIQRVEGGRLLRYTIYRFVDVEPQQGVSQ